MPHAECMRDNLNWHESCNPQYTLKMDNIELEAITVSSIQAARRACLSQSYVFYWLWDSQLVERLVCRSTKPHVMILLPPQICRAWQYLWHQDESSMVCHAWLISEMLVSVAVTLGYYHAMHWNGTWLTRTYFKMIHWLIIQNLWKYLLFWCEKK